LDYFTFITILEGDAARLARWRNRPNRLIALFFSEVRDPTLLRWN
jgi:hypothetical protein